MTNSNEQKGWIERLKAQTWFYSRYGQGTGSAAQEVISFFSQEKEISFKEGQETEAIAHQKEDVSAYEAGRATALRLVSEKLPKEETEPANAGYSGVEASMYSWAKSHNTLLRKVHTIIHSLQEEK